MICSANSAALLLLALVGADAHGAVVWPPPRNAIDWQNVTAQSQATYAAQLNAAQLNAAQFCAIL